MERYVTQPSRDCLRVLATEALNVFGGPNSFGATRHECGTMLDASSPGGPSRCT